MSEPKQMVQSFGRKKNAIAVATVVKGKGITVFGAVQSSFCLVPLYLIPCEFGRILVFESYLNKKIM